MKKKNISLGQDELRILNEEYNIDVTNPASIQAFQDKTQKKLESIHEVKRLIYLSLNKHRKKRTPSGKKCSFCLMSENEVYGMAKHDSGFNLCTQCIKMIHQSGENPWNV